MRSPEDIENWLLDKIAHVYLRPAMYAHTQSELDIQLTNLHYFWAFVVGREDDFRRAYQPLQNSNGSARRPPGFFEQIEDASSLDVIMKQWQAVDGELGITIPTPQRLIPGPNAISIE